MHRSYTRVPIDSTEVFGIHGVGYLKGKSSMILFEQYSQLKKNFKGHSFWARGYDASTVGLDEAKERKHMRDQEWNESIEDRYDTDLSNPF